MHVVIVDDNETDRFLLRHQVKRQRTDDQTLEMLEFADGASALDFLRDPGAFGPAGALVFVDIRMPLMTGLELLEALLEAGADHLRASNVQILVVTSSANPGDRERATANPLVKEYVVKPLGKEDLGRLLTLG